MINASYNTINLGLISAMSASSVATATDIMFYINLVLVFMALIEMTAFVVLCKKTSCAVVTGLAAILLFGMGMVVFVIQLILYALSQSFAVYFVYLCLAIFFGGFVVGGVYCVMLSRNSHKALCIASGVCSVIPPISAALVTCLSYKIHRDTRGQSLVFNGYAYTYAALGEFCSKNGVDFVDMSGNMKFKPLGKKSAKKYLKELKRGAYDAAGKYKYAAALIHYIPYKYKKALKLMQKAADGHCSAALFNLGYYYEMGAYVKLDLKKANGYYVKAADAGDTDAALRLAIIAIKNGNAVEGMRILQDRVESMDDICAKYNIGVCYEKGYGTEANIDKALDIYEECAKAGLHFAQRHLFAIAGTDINSPQNGDFFRKVTDREFVGEFGVMIKGLVEIKKRHAADAAEIFLNAVRYKGAWEGLARCLVGTLYIDCGKLPVDRKNGVEYIKSAIPLLPDARHIYSVVSNSDVYKNKKDK